MELHNVVTGIFNDLMVIQQKADHLQQKWGRVKEDVRSSDHNCNDYPQLVHQRVGNTSNNHAEVYR